MEGEQGGQGALWTQPLWTRTPLDPATVDPVMDPETLDPATLDLATMDPTPWYFSTFFFILVLHSDGRSKVPEAL